jgi:transposase
MLRKEDFAVMKALKKRGVYQVDIAAELGVHPKTVSRALKRDGPPVGKRQQRGSKLDPYKEQIDQLLAEGVWNAMVILREIEARGYDGGRTILREYIAPKRALRPGRATVRFETEPGQQMQSDWGEVVSEVAGEEVKVCFLVNQLSYSRRFHFWCTDRQDAEHTYQGLINSFTYFGGVPQEVLVDNHKAAVVAHRAGQSPRFNERFLDLAGHYGFTPRACQPYRARTKGKDERMVGYVKHHFFVRYRTFDSWAHLNQLAERWLSEEADQRRQQSLKEVVAERFVREQPALTPLPTQPYDTAYRQSRHVGWDGYIDVRGNRYSVPGHLAGRLVAVRIGLDDSLRVYDSEELVASHWLRSAQAGWVTVPEHHAQLWRDTLRVDQRPLSVYEEVATWN